MEFGENSAIYVQIADQFCENILLAKLKPGDRIPSVREMAVTLEVNPNTVLRTYNYLQDMGIIFNKRGIGYYVSDEGFQRTRDLRRQDFINNEIPGFFKAMSLLNLSLQDIEVYFREFQNSHGK